MTQVPFGILGHLSLPLPEGQEDLWKKNSPWLPVMTARNNNVYHSQGASKAVALATAAADTCTTASATEQPAFMDTETGPTLPSKSNGLATDPRFWTREDVATFLGQCENEFELPSLDVNKFQMNGKAICLLDKDDLKSRAPYAGDVIFSALQQWPRISQNKAGLQPGLPQQGLGQGNAVAADATDSRPKQPGKSAPSLDGQVAGSSQALGKELAQNVSQGQVTSTSAGPSRADSANNGNRERTPVRSQSNGHSYENSIPGTSSSTISLDGENESCVSLLATPGSALSSSSPGSEKMRLLEFLKKLLNDLQQKYDNVIIWEDVDEGIFKIVDPRAKPVKVRRTSPDKADKPMSLWGLLKSAIGKDLTKMPLPVNFSEPLSMLQWLTDDYEYSAILDRATLLSDSLEQMAFVAAFTVSSYASCAYRTSKQFNPLLGETYECDRTDDLGWRVIAEQVCHHPPIASLHCQSAMGWVQWQQFTMESNFKGKYLEIHPLGIAHLRFINDDNHYTWRKVSTIVRNLYMGKMYIEQEGEMDIVNHTTGDKCHMKYSCGGMFSRDRTVTEKNYNRTNEPNREIKGAWDTELTAARLDDKGKSNESFRILWQKKELPRDADKRYNFSVFACQLNEKEEWAAPTDSSNRPDQRFMEDAKWDEAKTETTEDRQRKSRISRLVERAANYNTSSNITRLMRSLHGSPTGPDDGMELYYTPCWFTRQRDPLSGQYIYMFNREY